MVAMDAQMTESGSKAARILVVDDEKPVREFVSRALAHANRRYQVDTAEDGLQALEAMSAERYDMLVTDIVMPGLDGIALALKVSKDYPDVTILLMTGYATEKQRAYGLQSLIHQVISKPFSLKELTATVKEALAGRSS
jgi:DNA-binding response OmpR family regulator